MIEALATLAAAGLAFVVLTVVLDIAHEIGYALVSLILVEPAGQVDLFLGSEGLAERARPGASTWRLGRLRVYFDGAGLFFGGDMDANYYRAGLAGWREALIAVAGPVVSTLFAISAAAIISARPPLVASGAAIGSGVAALSGTLDLIPVDFGGRSSDGMIAVKGFKAGRAHMP
jgi:hypothetical protein